MTEPGQEFKALQVQEGSNPELVLRSHRLSLKETARGLSDGAIIMREMGDNVSAQEADEVWPFLEDIEKLFLEGTSDGVWRGYHKLSTIDIAGLAASTPYEEEAQRHFDQLKALLFAAFEHDLKGRAEYMNTFLSAHQALVEVRPGSMLVSVGYEIASLGDSQITIASPATLRARLSDGTVLTDTDITQIQPTVLFENLSESCQKTLRTLWDLHEEVHLV